MIANESPASARWPRCRQDLAALLWASFLVAAAASVVCFAYLDPALLDFLPPAEDSTTGRMTGYGIGFFFLWAVAAAASTLTLYLARTERPDLDDREQR